MPAHQERKINQEINLALHEHQYQTKMVKSDVEKFHSHWIDRV